MPKTTICSFEPCDRTVYAKSLCAPHYQQKRTGKALIPVGQSRTTVQERFWAKVEKTDGCWKWTGSMTHNGYGQMWVTDRLYRAHRIAWAWSHGEIPDGFIVDHRCLERACVRPDHLRLADPKQNMEHRAGSNKNSVSGIRGVSWNEARQKWRAQVTHNRKNTCIGNFDTVEEAAEAVKAKRLELFTHNDRDRD